jgi:hypothetical protein
MQSVPITTNVVSSNPAHGEVYSIQLYVIKFVSDLRQVGGFLTGWTGGRQFPLPSPPSSHFPPLIHFFPPKFRKKYLLIYNILLYKSKSSKNLETFSALLFFCPSLSMNLHSKIIHCNLSNTY